MNCLVALVYAASTIIIRSDVAEAEYRALALRPQFAAAARIVLDSAGSGSGSGVLIAPQWVVTAAHVAMPQKVSELSVLIGGERLRVLRVVLHPEYTKQSGIARAQYDQALLQLERPSTVQPARVDERLPELGALVTMVGFGVGGVGARDSAGTLRAATNRVDQIGGMLRTMSLASNLLVMDFDVPDSPGANTLGSATPEPLEGLASGGDSGGGLFVERNNTWWLTGTFVLSSVNLAGTVSRSFAGSTNAFVGIAPHRDWILSVVR